MNDAKLFLSTMLYMASKRLGYTRANAELMSQIQNAGDALKEDLADWRGIAAALTLARAATLEPAILNVNSGGTVIAKARSVAAHEFLKSTADVWLSVDDDVVVSLGAVEAMVTQARAEPCMVIAPCLTRFGSRANLDVGLWAPSVEVTERAPNGVKLALIEAGGFGCFAVSRAVIERAHEAAGPERDFEQEGVEGVVRAIFGDEIRDRRWVTEDLAFCRRHLTGFRCWAVRGGYTVHNGLRLDLATLEHLIERRDNGQGVRA